MSVRAWHGLFNIDKPTGWTSRAVVDRVNRLVGKVKAGHAGTLDPLATGVLVVCVGAATRLVDRIQEHPKGYRAGLRLGVRSDTDDVTGRVEAGGDPAGVTREQLQSLCREFLGDIAQVPPRVSAVHVEGQRAYDLARGNRDFELTARTVRVEAIELVDFQGTDAQLEMTCGSGTYVRALIRDLGERLGCGAVMTSLRRTFVGPFIAERALSLETLTVDDLSRHLLPMATVLTDEPVYKATAAECAALLQGRAISCGNDFPCESIGRVAVLNDQPDLFAFALLDPERRLLFPQRVFIR